ncbi:MAG: hypothetical protein JSW39_26960 [Desulfobacterales bacterium]|nr:MAG: hypothetical protein JSW39_26960 [Desulfobacterales bacterium]
MTKKACLQITVKSCLMSRWSRSSLIPLLLGSFFCVAADAVADWTFYRSTAVRSPEKHTFRIDRASNKPANAWFILWPRMKGAFASKLPLYQVDENPVHDLNLVKRGLEVNPEKDHWIKWQIFDGKGPLNDELREFMNGKEVTFQYYLPDGTIKETTFDLKGAREAIEEILR